MHEPVKKNILLFHCVSKQQLGGGGGPMQAGQVAPNQNFLNRPPGPIPVSHGNVQQQVSEPTRCWHVRLCLHTGSPLTWPVVDTFTAPVPAEFCMPYW